MKILNTYSLGTGDRFAHQAKFQLEAVRAAAELGIQLDIVWNKSKREHLSIGSGPEQTRRAGEAAIMELQDRGRWTGRHYFDADHIRLGTYKEFLPYCDFFTLDVADKINVPGDAETREGFLKAAEAYLERPLPIPGMQKDLFISRDSAREVADCYLQAAKSAGELYRSIAADPRAEHAIIEVSMDETARSQSPEEIFLILLALSRENIPFQTFAPRFSGRFNKGVDYVGDPNIFKEEFEADALILNYAAKELGLPENLKLSLHSGSDKFSIYPAIHEVLSIHDVGLHVKTAGTSWLEELIGLCEAGGEGAEMVRHIYSLCLERMDELCAPYQEVIDIDKAMLPSDKEIQNMAAHVLAASIRHDEEEERYNPSLRQLLHVGYKVAASMGTEYSDMIRKHRSGIGFHVKNNLLERHIRCIFPGRK